MAILKDLIVQNAARVIGPVYANSFIKAGGTSSQFLKADGSVDTNTYALSSSIPSFAAAGSTTQPVYLSAANTFATCTTYAGGTAVTLNGTSLAGSTASFYAPTSTGTSGQFLKWPASGNVPTWETFPTIPAAPGTLNTTATTAQSTAASEALSGTITLHKIAKTGTYSDLIGTPTIPNSWSTITPSNNNTVDELTTGTIFPLTTLSQNDILYIKAYNKWININGPLKGQSPKPLNIAHSVIGKVEAIGVDGLYSIIFDAAGHITKASEAGLNDLADVDTTGVSDGYTLYYDSGNSSWVPGLLSNTDYVYYCGTPAATAAKTATSKSTNTPVANHYYWVYIGAANSASSALTFSANSSTAASIYINGTASSSSNYTLPVGLYFVYYSGTGTGKGWYFNTDGTMTIMGNQFDGVETDLNVEQVALATSSTDEYPIASTYSPYGTQTSGLVAGVNYANRVKLTGSGNIVLDSFAASTASPSLILRSGPTGTYRYWYIKNNSSYSLEIGGATATSNVPYGTITIQGNGDITLAPQSGGGYITATGFKALNHISSSIGYLKSDGNVDTTTYSALTSYSGNANKVLAVNANADGLTWVTQSGGGTDEKVKQNFLGSSDNNEYPLLAAGSTAPAGSAQESYYSSTTLNKDGDITFTKSATSCSLKYDSTNLCLNVSFS